jgi:addiction module HigA family antidote
MKKGLEPVHPGEILKEEFMEPRGLSITELAKGIGISRTNLSHVVNQHAGISTELAIKLSEAFGTTPQFWITLQQNFDLWFAEKKIDRKAITHFRTIAASL